jgi:hypothetical protein
MVFDIDTISHAVDKVTLEIITGVIWNSERLKKIIEILAENEDYRYCLKEIEDIPLSVFLSEHLYKLNGEIRRINEAKVTDILNRLGAILPDSEGLDNSFMLIDKTLETMSEEWDRISEKFRFQNGTFYLYEIVENFLGMRGDN